MQLGRIYLKQGNHAAAERGFQRAIELSNGRGDAVSWARGHAHRRRQASAGAPSQRGVSGHEPERRDPLFAAARVYMAAGDTPKAEATLKTILGLDPANMDAYIELTNIYIREQKLDDARGQLEAIVAKQPKAVWAHTMIAQSLHLQNRTAEARQRYERILEIDPRAAIAANNLAMMLLQEGQSLDRALELAQTAKQQEPDNPNFNDTLGAVYLRKGLADLAVPPAGILGPEGPVESRVPVHLGQAYAQAGRTGRSQGRTSKGARPQRPIRRGGRRPSGSSADWLRTADRRRGLLRRQKSSVAANNRLAILKKDSIFKHLRQSSTWQKACKVVATSIFEARLSLDWSWKK